MWWKMKQFQPLFWKKSLNNSHFQGMASKIDGGFSIYMIIFTKKYWYWILIFQHLADWILTTILQYLKSILNTNTFILYCLMLWDKCTVCVTEYSHNRSLTVTYGQNWRESYVFWICIFSKKKESNWQTDLNARRQ